MTETPLLSLSEAARVLNVSRQTVWRLVRDGHLPAVKVGRLIRVDPDELERYVYGRDRELVA